MKKIAKNDTPRLCVFTPTYNRASTLVNCYTSLINQTNADFQWMIIDDGSTDQTEEIVNEWIKENLIQIKYIKKHNQGKIRAIEDSLIICDSPLWLCLDSDDELYSDAIEQIINKYDSVFAEAKCCGLLGVRYAKNGNPMQGRQYIKKVNQLADKIQFMEVRYKYRIPPEYCLVYKTDILKKYHYPLFLGERFMPESSVYCLMDKDEYYYLPIKTPIMICELRRDGLTNNHSMNVENNPKGYTYTQGVIADNCRYFYGIFRASICYQIGRLLGGDAYNFTRIGRKLFIEMLKPVSVIPWIVKYKIKKG